ncbi:hypothetical protein ASD21_17420 [Caulobacter sp. Root1455]|jgi:hypothetical protein|uniref:surface-adhesin E family protein n=1 Tax=Caulobacter sp. Root1455 TaxID=1736465 RepID=UPI0006F77A07|nr:surface-adhesin E family protein [Caulobacter sp. Root1455]KQY91467.1 hypothetical protein ASD21_17420 [Caulobacter sp. Root1455]
MFGLIFMLQTAPIQDAPSAVDSVTVSPEKQATQRMPLWAEKIQPRDWPFIGGVADRSILVFAKTAATPPGSPYPRVWIRHEYSGPQADAADGVALAPYRSEKLVEEVDCGKQLFRRLKAYRHGDNNLEGPTQALGFTEAAWTVPEPDTFDATIVRDACL